MPTGDRINHALKLLLCHNCCLASFLGRQTLHAQISVLQSFFFFVRLLIRISAQWQQMPRGLRILITDMLFGLFLLLEADSPC